MDIIEIKNLEIFANHGVFPEENVLGQKFVVSAKLYTSTRKAGLTDELTASIHYGEVSQMITKFTKEHTYKLLEALAENLCQMLLHGAGLGCCGPGHAGANRVEQAPACHLGNGFGGFANPVQKFGVSLVYF